MKKLNEKMWQRFSMNNVFNIGHGFYNKKPPMSPNGTVPFVGASGINNGITGFCTMQAVRDNSKIGYGPNEPIERKLFDRGSICVVNNGSAIGYSYYQPKQFTCTHDVNPLTLRDHEVSEDEALFLSQMIREQGVCFIYARKWRPSRMVRSQFLLPVDDNGKPDYDYMEQYASKMREGMLMRYRNYVAGQLSRLEYRDIPALGKKEWKEFRIGELFEVSRPKARNKDNYDMGDIPFVASGTMNNGVMKCCKTRKGEELDAGNCITVSPVDGSSFYQPMDFLGRGGAGSSILMLRNSGLNVFRGEFMARMIQQTCSKYNYGHMGNKDSIKREHVMLPIDDDGKPDYAYMEQYVKNMMLRKYEQYLKYTERKKSS